MFSQLFNFQFKRTGKQAFGFYLAYLFLGMLIGALAGGLYSIITGVGDFNTGALIGNIVAIIFVLILSVIITLQKNAFSFLTLSLIILSGVLAVLLGCLGGLIPVAYLSTLDGVKKDYTNIDA